LNRYQRNLLTRYRKERQRNQLAGPGRHDFIIVLDGLKPGYNVAKIFRSAEAFGAAAVWLVDIGPFDPAPAKGSFRKVPAKFFATFPECHSALRSSGYTGYLLDPAAARRLPAASLESKSAFIFGNEEFGASFDPAAYADLQRIAIPQFGAVQSLNVSVAASIVMYEYVRQQIAATGRDCEPAER